MKKRQVLALTLAATMVLGSSMQVFAADEAGVDTTGKTVTGSGDVSYIDTNIYSVTLPTEASTSLVVDPQGISQMENNSVATAEQLASGAGKITCADTPIVTNLSSVPMKVSVELKLTGDATSVTTVADVEKDTVANVLLYAVPSATDTRGAKAGYSASTKGVVLSPTAATLDFILGAAAYNYKKDSNGDVTYERVDGETGHGTGLQFGGYVNKKADWKDFVGDSASKSIGMEAKFTFTKEIADGEAADTTEGAPYAMKTYAGTTVEVTPPAPEDVAPSITPTSYTMTAGQPVEITFDLGSGDLEATGIKSVTWEGATWTNGKHYTVEGNKLKVTSATVDYFLNSGTTSTKIAVIFDNSESTSVEANLAAASE